MNHGLRNGILSSAKQRNRLKVLPSIHVSPTSSHSSPRADNVNASEAPSDFHLHSALVYPNFLTKEEGDALEIDVLKRMRRKRFESGHWDAVITEYKEVELTIPSDANYIHNTRNPLSPLSCDAISRVRDHLTQTHFIGSIMKDVERDENPYPTRTTAPVEWLNCHAIHLKKDGELTAHVDSVKFSGGIVAGLSLKSTAIMRLQPAQTSEISNTLGESDESDESDESSSSVSQEIYHHRINDQKATNNKGTNTSPRSEKLLGKGQVDLLLPPLSLYVLSGVSRYNYTHELLPSASQFESNFCSDESKIIREEVNRDDRISIIFRDAL